MAKIDVTLSDINFRFKEFVCHPCKYGTFSGNNHIVECEDDEADFYGVYLRDEAGILHQIADVDGDKELALKVVSTLNSMCEYYSPKFPNGFDSWRETHFEIVQAITRAAQKDDSGIVKDRQMCGGFTELYTLAEELTDEFEDMNAGRQWDGEFIDEVEDFANEKLYGK